MTDKCPHGVEGDLVAAGNCPFCYFDQDDPPPANPFEGVPHCDICGMPDETVVNGECRDCAIEQEIKNKRMEDV